MKSNRKWYITINGIEKEIFSDVDGLKIQDKEDRLLKAGRRKIDTTLRIRGYFNYSPFSC